MVLLRERTGETYAPCSADAWRATLDAWSADRQRIATHPTLVRARERASRFHRNGAGYGWGLYHVAERALRLRGLPAPMPDGHCMFADPAAYGLVRVG